MHGDLIIQPAASDGGSDDDVIATLSSFEPLIPRTGATNFIDAATASLLPLVDFSLDIPDIGRPAGVGEPAIGMPVAKVGGSTGLTEGVVVDLDLDTSVYLDHTNLGRSWWFQGLFKIHPIGEGPSFAAPGDSGAAIVDLDSRRIIGLLFTGSKDGKVSFAIPIKSIESRLKVRVIF